jgi:hypothetical protein
MSSESEDENQAGPSYRSGAGRSNGARRYDFIRIILLQILIEFDFHLVLEDWCQKRIGAYSVMNCCI